MEDGVGELEDGVVDMVDGENGVGNMKWDMEIRRWEM